MPILSSLLTKNEGRKIPRLDKENVEELRAQVTAIGLSAAGTKTSLIRITITCIDGKHNFPPQRPT